MNEVERKDNIKESDSQNITILEEPKDEMPKEPVEAYRAGALLKSKKPEGYSSVIKPPLNNAVAAVNVSVA